MTTSTFDTTSDGLTPEQQAAEALALAQGEKIAAAEAEDKARLYKKADDENEGVALIGGKFKSQDDLLKAYQELQKKLGSPDEEAAPEAADETTEETTDEPEPEQTDETVDYMQQLGKEYEETGSLSEEAIDRLAQMDQKQLIQSYLKYYQQSAQSAQQAQLQDAAIADIKQSVGGEEAYSEMIQWAGENLDTTEIDNFNAVTATNNPAAIRFAVEALNNRYRSEVGYEAPLISGNKGSSGPKPYRSNAELARDIANPLYQSDPAFRADVEARLARSNDLL
jgi:hypothetical protein